MKYLRPMFGFLSISLLSLSLIAIAVIRLSAETDTHGNSHVEKVILTTIATDQTQLLDNSTALFDFGTVSEGAVTPIVHLFYLRNDCRQPITLTSLKPSCGCTTAVINNMGSRTLPVDIIPGQVVEIQVSINATYLSNGRTDKAVFIYTKGQSQPSATLNMEGDIVPFSAFFPTILDFGRVSIHGRRSLIFTVSNLSLQASDIKPLFLSADANISVRGLALSNPKPDQYSGEISARELPKTKTYVATLIPEKRIGLVTGTLSVMPVIPLANVHIRSTELHWVANIVGSISASPTAGFFGIVKAGRTAHLTIRLTENAPYSLEKAQIVCTPFLTAKLNLRPSDVAKQKRLQQASSRSGFTLHRKAGGLSSRGNETLLTVVLSTSAPVGTLDAKVTVVTRSGEHLVLPVSALVVQSDNIP